MRGGGGDASNQPVPMSNVQTVSNAIKDPKQERNTAAVQGGNYFNPEDSKDISTSDFSD